MPEDRLPLLIFPQPRSTNPPRGKPFPPSQYTLPDHNRQVVRLRQKIQDINLEFTKFRATVDSTIMGGEPELVLVLELADRIDNLERAVNAAGLEWLGEWDIDMDPDDDFPPPGQKVVRDGRIFVSMVNQSGMREILSLWKKWSRKTPLPRGKTKWRDIFQCLKNIRRWSVQETLVETGMKEYFENLNDEEVANFQIESFCHKDSGKREKVETDIRNFLNQEGGETTSNFIYMPDIAFHAVKARLSVKRIKRLLANAEQQPESLHLFLYPGIMYFRRTGQSIVSNEEGDGEEAEYPQTETAYPPIAAILDGVPNLQHKALQNRVDFDDPFDLSGKYQPGERLHGTAVTSLLIHGDRAASMTAPIHSKVHHVAVMEPNLDARRLGRKIEYFPEDCFYEDRIEQAVRRILDKDGEMSALAPTVKIINLSLGDETRPFIHTPSPWARLLDWLSWKYRVLFCISAGNYLDSYDFGIPYSEYQSKSDEEKTRLLLEAMQNTLSKRRLLAPAESINALTIGALHQDSSGDTYYLGQRIDLLPDNKLLSPISRLGHGFRRSIKPEIYFSGGRQLYTSLSTGSEFRIDESLIAPGQKVARDSSQEGELSTEVFSRGTSNATALATRAGVQIYEILSQLNNEDDQIPDAVVAVLIKALLVHGSVQNREAQQTIKHLDTHNSRQFRAVLARYLGYGSVNIERVLGCTGQRATVIGFGEITTNKIHEYRFPIPREFGGQKAFRRMIVTLAWFSPINPKHRDLREAKVTIVPDKTWKKTSLKLARTDGEHNQIKRGTVQHEVLEGHDELAVFQQDEEIAFRIRCTGEATESLKENIPYGLAVTLEAAEESQIPVYEKIKERLSTQAEIKDLQRDL